MTFSIPKSIIKSISILAMTTSMLCNIQVASAQMDTSHEFTENRLRSEFLQYFERGFFPTDVIDDPHPGSYLWTHQPFELGQSASLSSSSTWNALSTKPGAALLGSALIPGLSQAANKQYWKTALYVAAEAATIILAIEGNNRGRRLEREYIQTGDANWSVVKYASWVHNYYHNVPGARGPNAPDIDILSLLTAEGLAEYQRQGGFPSPVFDTEREWAWINLPALRQLERSSLYLVSGRPFSHDVPDFGSQQYYELMSKYFQFGPGWRDWDSRTHDVNSGLSGMSPMWLHHTRLEERFNDSFRFAGNMLTLMVVNHVVSAFDAYFTIKLKNHRIESGVAVLPGSVNYQLRFNF